jgi:hypothetical protein
MNEQAYPIKYFRKSIRYVIPWVFFKKKLVIVVKCKLNS